MKEVFGKLCSFLKDEDGGLSVLCGDVCNKLPRLFEEMNVNDC